MEFTISYNKVIPKEKHSLEDDRVEYNFRREMTRILRGEVKNVVYSVKKNRPDHAHRIVSAATRYIQYNKLPLKVVKRENHVFIQRTPTAMEKKMAQA